MQKWILNPKYYAKYSRLDWCTAIKDPDASEWAISPEYYRNIVVKNPKESDIPHVLDHVKLKIESVSKHDLIAFHAILSKSSREVGHVCKPDFVHEGGSIFLSVTLRNKKTQIATPWSGKGVLVRTSEGWMSHRLCFIWGGRAILENPELIDRLIAIATENER